MGERITVTVESGVSLHDLNENGKYRADDYCYKQDNYEGQRYTCGGSNIHGTDNLILYPYLKVFSL